MWGGNKKYIVLKISYIGLENLRGFLTGELVTGVESLENRINMPAILTHFIRKQKIITRCTIVYMSYVAKLLLKCENCKKILYNR